MAAAVFSIGAGRRAPLNNPPPPYKIEPNFLPNLWLIKIFLWGIRRQFV